MAKKKKRTTKKKTANRTAKATGKSAPKRKPTADRTNSPAQVTGTLIAAPGDML